MEYNCLNCGHAKWKHYKLFKECVIKECDCKHYETKPFKPVQLRRQNEGKGQGEQKGKS